MPRISRFRLALCISAILALLSAPLATAGPRVTSATALRIHEGSLSAAWNWLEDLIGFRGSALGRVSGFKPAQPAQKDGKLPAPTGNSCIDPQGKPRPWCLE